MLFAIGLLGHRCQGSIAERGALPPQLHRRSEPQLAIDGKRGDHGVGTEDSPDLRVDGFAALHVAKRLSFRGLQRCVDPDGDLSAMAVHAHKQDG